MFDIDKVRKEMNDQDNMIIDIKNVDGGDIRIDLKNGDKLCYIDGEIFECIDLANLGCVRIDIKTSLNEVLNLYKKFLPALSTILDSFEIINRYGDIDDIGMRYIKENQHFLVEIDEEDFLITLEIDLDGKIIDSDFYNDRCWELAEKKDKILDDLSVI